MNPANLKALVDQHSAGPTASSMGMAPPAEGDADEEDDMDDEPEPAVSGAEKGNQLIAEWGEFGKTLKEEAKELHDLAHDVGAELLLKEVPDDAIKAVGKAVDHMPDELSMGFAKYISALSPEDCHGLAEALVADVGEDSADVNLLAAFIDQAGKYAKDEIDVDDDFNEPEEDDEEEEDDEDKADDGDKAAPPAAAAAPEKAPPAAGAAS